MVRLDMMGLVSGTYAAGLHCLCTHTEKHLTNTSLARACSPPPPPRPAMSTNDLHIYSASLTTDTSVPRPRRACLACAMSWSIPRVGLPCCSPPLTHTSLVLPAYSGPIYRAPARSAPLAMSRLQALPSRRHRLPHGGALSTRLRFNPESAVLAPVLLVLRARQKVHFSITTSLPRAARFLAHHQPRNIVDMLPPTSRSS